MRQLRIVDSKVEANKIWVMSTLKIHYQNFNFNCFLMVKCHHQVTNSSNLYVTALKLLGNCEYIHRHTGLAINPFQTNGIFHKATYNSQDGLLYKG